MPSRWIAPWLLLAVVTGACASSTPAERPEAPPPPALLKSPIALLLEHHAELGLTTDQMIEVGKQETALQEKNRPLRMQLRDLRPPGPPRVAPSGGAPDMSPPPGVNPRGWGGGTNRGRATRMGQGPLAVEPETEEARQQRKERVEAILREMDKNIDGAYSEVEKVLDDSQRARARELVEQQRQERQRAREAFEVPSPPPEA
ncbi:hypothetical protein P2318_20060 [Myxococcaceae bacterium GXIMD 01537]